MWPGPLCSERLATDRRDWTPIAVAPTELTSAITAHTRQGRRGANHSLIHVIERVSNISMDMFGLGARVVAAIGSREWRASGARASLRLRLIARASRPRSLQWSCQSAQTFCSLL